MAKETILPARTLTSQPDANSTRKDQKGYQLPEEYDAQITNQEFDRLHERINKIVAEAAAISDVATGGSATAAANATAINSILALLRDSGLLRRS